MSEVDEIWLTYCGTLGRSYDIPCVIDALALLRERNCRIPEFIIIGDGPQKPEFEEYARNKQVNCRFLGRVPYDEMCAVLYRSDITVNPIVANAAQSIINKHADYAASGLPVINTQDSEEYRALVDRYDMGFNCINGSAKDIADKLEILINNKEIRLKKGAGARKCAKEKFDRKISYSTLVNVILQPLNQRKM